MGVINAYLILFLTAATSARAGDERPLSLSHCWVVVATGVPERAALENAGFRIAPTINRHDGQGTASVTVELLNGYLELIYPDPNRADFTSNKSRRGKVSLKIVLAHIRIFAHRNRIRSNASDTEEATVRHLESIG
jgi:hypothetical protein